MPISGLGGAREFRCATNWRVQTKAVAACVLGKTASGDAGPRPRRGSLWASGFWACARSPRGAKITVGQKAMGHALLFSPED
jgi:hypothetical protein